MGSQRRRRFGQVSATSFIIVAAVVSSSTAINRAPDLMGDYCRTRVPNCCDGRLDTCSVPISNTRCYCDTFCKNTTSEDCCPDYDEVCSGIPSQPIKLSICRFNRNIYRYGDSFKHNCNSCKCQQDGTVCCDQNLCVADENLLKLIKKLSPFYGWRPANYTKFWGSKFSEVLNVLGNSRRPTSAMRQAMNYATSIAKVKPKPQNLPLHFDARLKWFGLISGVAEQEWCNVAWAHVTAAVASDRLAIQTSAPHRLSADELIDCSDSGQKGCFRGGHLDRAWNTMRRIGLQPHQCYFRTDQHKCSTSRHCRRHKSGPLYRVAGEAHIQAEILTSGPVQATMRVYRDFFSYGGGVYRRLVDPYDSRVGSTVVRLVGWGVDRNSTKYWLAANTWGTKWGESGYFRILRGSNECGIEDTVLAAWAKVPNDGSRARRRRNDTMIISADQVVKRTRLHRTKLDNFNLI